VEGAPEAHEGLRVDGGFVPGTTLLVLGGGFRDEEGGLAVDFVCAIAGTAKEREGMK